MRRIAIASLLALATCPAWVHSSRAQPYYERPAAPYDTPRYDRGRDDGDQRRRDYDRRGPDEDRRRAEFDRRRAEEDRRQAELERAREEGRREERERARQNQQPSVPDALRGLLGR